MNEDLEIPLMRAKQTIRSRTALGVLATTLSIAVSTIAFLVREMRADAEKIQITAQPSELLVELVGVRADIRSLSERLTKIEQERQIEAAVRAATTQPGKLR